MVNLREIVSAISMRSGNQIEKTHKELTNNEETKDEC